MLELNNIYIKYQRLILDCKKLVIPSTGLCVIQGESGSGKSSLLKCISKQEDTCETYIYNDYIVDNIDSFKKEAICFLEQNPVFIENLSIKNHIKMMENIYQYTHTQEEIKLLELENLLHKFPNQLSGGEKTRVGLLLKLMKQAPILILDEPSSSLDLKYTQIVIGILKNYAKNHSVIVASHDNEIIREADILYEIKNTKLIQLKNNENTYSTQKSKKVIPLNLPSLFLSLHIKEKRKIYHTCELLILTIFIFLSSCGLSVFLIQPTIDNPFASVYQDEILVYKTPTGDITYSFNGLGAEFPFTQQELESIKKIDHIKKIEKSYFIGNDCNILEINDELNYNDNEELYMMNYIKNGEKIDLNYQFIESFALCSYDETEDYSQDINKVLNNKKDGIYISQSLAQKIGLENIDENSYLEFYFMIPVYHIYGDGIFPFKNEDGSYGSDGWPVLEYMGIRKKVTLPINGILNTSTLGVSLDNMFYTHRIYVPLSSYNKYIEKNKENDILQYEYSKKNSVYVRNLEKDDKSTNTIIAKPYENTLYRIKIDDVKNVEQVKKDINDLGFCAQEGETSPLLELFDNNNNDMMLILSLSILTILSIIYGIVHYLNRNNEKQIKEYMQSFGFTYKEINHLIRNSYLYDMGIVYTLVVVFGLIYYFGIGPILNYPIHLTLQFVLFALPLSFIVISVIPYIIYYFQKD